MLEAKQLGDRLTIVLQQEYLALLAGDLSEIERLLDIKLVLLEQAEALGGDALDVIKQLRSALQRNQLLAMSAIEGMRAALAREREVRSVARTLRTYGARGQDIQLEPDRNGVLSKRS